MDIAKYTRDVEYLGKLRDVAHEVAKTQHYGSHGEAEERLNKIELLRKGHEITHPFETVRKKYDTILRDDPNNIDTLCNMVFLLEKFYDDPDTATEYAMRASDVDNKLATEKLGLQRIFNYRLNSLD